MTEKDKAINEILDWANEETRIACDILKKDYADKPTECQRIMSGYHAALSAFEFLMEDIRKGSGTVNGNFNILTQLINGQPLTPIEDVPENWEEAAVSETGTAYICKRLKSLRKYVSKADGMTLYNDISRYRCIDINNPEVTYTSSIVTRILDEMFPITFPYQPVGIIKAFVEEFSTIQDDDSFDLIGILYFRHTDSRMTKVNRYFKLRSNVAPAVWVEIDVKEYNELKKNAKKPGGKIDG